MSFFLKKFTRQKHYFNQTKVKRVVMKEKFSMKKVLVTGADGFIGSHLVETLIDKGYEVRAFVYYNSFNNWGWLDTIS